MDMIQASLMVKFNSDRRDAEAKFGTPNLTPAQNGGDGGGADGGGGE